MAIHLDPNMFTLGAVKLDSNPSVNMYAQLHARREAQKLAKEDAFKDYINNLNTKITPTGVRVDDLKAFDDLKNKWVEFGMKNKDALMKNDIAAQGEFSKRYQELMNLTTRSRAEEEKKKPFVEVMVDPNKRKFASSKLIEDLHNHDQPLLVQDEKGNWGENRNRKSLDYAENYFNPQLDFDKEFTGWSKGQERGKTYGDIIKNDPKSGTVTFATEEKFTPDQIKQIADNAIKGVADKNSEANNYYRHKLENLKPDDEIKLNKAFQSVYGGGAEYVQPDGKIVKGQNVIDSPEELAAAEAIIQAQSMAKKGEEMKLDKDLANQRAQINISLNKSGGASGDIGDYDVLGSYKSKIVPKEVKTGTTVLGADKKETRNVVPANEVDANHKKLIGEVSPYTADDGSKYFIVREDGDWEGKNGQVISASVVARKNMDATSLTEVKRGALGLKPNQQVPTGAKYSIKGKTYTHAELLKLGYTPEQIAPFKQK